MLDPANTTLFRADFLQQIGTKLPRTLNAFLLGLKTSYILPSPHFKSNFPRWDVGEFMTRTYIKRVNAIGPRKLVLTSHTASTHLSKEMNILFTTQDSQHASVANEILSDHRGELSDGDASAVSRPVICTATDTNQPSPG